jgi:hypothetical protein
MKAIDIAKYIDKNVGTFLDIEIVGPGIAYHYCRHVRKQTMCPDYSLEDLGQILQGELVNAFRRELLDYGKVCSESGQSSGTSAGGLLHGCSTNAS